MFASIDGFQGIFAPPAYHPPQDITTKGCIGQPQSAFPQEQRLTNPRAGS